jgi:hypothetical protein
MILANFVSEEIGEPKTYDRPSAFNNAVISRRCLRWTVDRVIYCLFGQNVANLVHLWRFEAKWDFSGRKSGLSLCSTVSTLKLTCCLANGGGGETYQPWQPYWYWSLTFLRPAPSWDVLLKFWSSIHPLLVPIHRLFPIQPNILDQSQAGATARV